MTAEGYVNSVAFELRDLPWGMRRDLVAELRGHLDELPPGTDLVARLGPPEQYAADLRTAAGLERRRGVIAFLRARRPRNLILTVVALTLVGLAIGGVVWVDSYQPLASGNFSRNPAGTLGDPAGGGAVVFHQGRPFEFGLEIRNTGRFAVRVLGVPYPTSVPFTARLMISMPSSSGGYQRSAEPFHPFKLKPGMRAFLVLKGAYAHCRAWSPGGASILEDFPVRFSYLWRTATAEIPLPERLAIVFPRKGTCR